MRSSAMGQEVTLTIDSSAVVAIILREPTEEALVTKILRAGGGHIAAPNFLEVYMVLRPRLGEKAGSILESKMDELEIIVVPFASEHAQAATRAFDRYGKGRHPASLNFGDCIAYALARTTDEPLLFVGDDFSKTDVRIA